MSNTLTHSVLLRETLKSQFPLTIVPYTVFSPCSNDIIFFYAYWIKHHLSPSLGVYASDVCAKECKKRREKIQKLGFQLKRGTRYIYTMLNQILVPSFLFVLQAIVHVQIKYNITFIKLRAKNKSMNAIDI